jgi:hypothetical protein
MTGNAGHSVRVLSFALLTHFNASHRSGLKKEILDDFRDEAALFGFGRFADDGGKIELAFR